MPLTIIADGFFRKTDPAPHKERPDAAVHDGAFYTCPAAAAVQASWATVERRPAQRSSASGAEQSNDSDSGSTAEGEPQRWHVVYVGDLEALMDNDRMAALREGLGAVLEGTAYIVSSPAEGHIAVHHPLTGDALLHAAAVASVVQAALVWDRSDPIVVRCGHRTVHCRPTFAEANRWWNVSATEVAPGAAESTRVD